MFEKYYDNYSSMQQKQVPSPIKLFVDEGWRTSSHAEKTKIGHIWSKYALKLSSVLDYGGGNRLTGELLKNLGYAGIYEVCDMDYGVNPEYRHLYDIKKKYDLVTCFQVIEHIYFEDFLELLPKLTELIKPGGWLAIGSDNPAHPNHLWNIQMGHIKSYPYKGLHRYLQTIGFKSDNSEVILQYVAKNRLKDKLRYRLRKFTSKLLDFDCHHSYIIFIQKN